MGRKIVIVAVVLLVALLLALFSTNSASGDATAWLTNTYGAFVRSTSSIGTVPTLPVETESAAAVPEGSEQLDSEEQRRSEGSSTTTKGGQRKSSAMQQHKKKKDKKEEKAVEKKKPRPQEEEKEELPAEKWGQTRVIFNFSHPFDTEELLGPSPNEPPKNGEALCEFFIMSHRLCKVLAGKETFLECVYRHGALNWHRALPSKCTLSPFWKGLMEREKDPSQRKSKMKIEEDGCNYAKLRDAVAAIQINRDEAMTPLAYVPPEERSIPDYGPPRSCPYGKLYPIRIGVPSVNVVPRVSRLKMFDFVPFLPRKFPMWAYKTPPYRIGARDEILASLVQQYSYFSFTHKRGGWDCQRHVEILANGCVPFFADLPACSKYCMAGLPKKLLLDVLGMQGVSHIAPGSKFISKRAGAMINFERPGTIDWASFDEEHYFQIADYLLNYTRHFLTNKATMSYVLKTIGYEEPKRVLMLATNPRNIDYITRSVENGLIDLGLHVTTNGDDWVQGQYMQHVEERPFTEESCDGVTTTDFELVRERKGIVSSLHGAGMVVAMRSDPFCRGAKEWGQRLSHRILNKEFDLVIYPFLHKMSDQPLWREVSSVMDPTRIVVIDGNDDIGDPMQLVREYLKRGIHVFRREMNGGDRC